MQPQKKDNSLSAEEIRCEFNIAAIDSIALQYKIAISRSRVSGFEMEST